MFLFPTHSHRTTHSWGNILAHHCGWSHKVSHGQAFLARNWHVQQLAALYGFNSLILGACQCLPSKHSSELQKYLLSFPPHPQGHLTLLVQRPHDLAFQAAYSRPAHVSTAPFGSHCGWPIYELGSLPPRPWLYLLRVDDAETIGTSLKGDGKWLSWGGASLQLLGNR